MPKVPSKKDAPKSTPVSNETRPLVYPDETMEICLAKKGNAITVERIKELMGWTEETDEIKFKKGEYVEEIETLLKRKVQLRANPNNRPIYPSNILDLTQILLNKRWEWNGEPIIIGKYGAFLNGQHSGIALVYANELREKGPKAEHWLQVHPVPITMDKTIVYGVEETDRVINTMDTCKSRSLMDVIFRSGFFRDTKASGDRKALAKVMEHAVRLLWDRTGASQDAYSPRKTTLDCVNFIERHATLVECVNHIWEENGDQNDIRRYITLGYASGLMYLMAAGKSNGEAYRALETPNESGLDTSYLKKAKAFWAEFTSGDTRAFEQFNPLRKAIGLLEDVETGKSGTMVEKMALFCRAWMAYREGLPIHDAVLTSTDLETGAPLPKVDGIQTEKPNLKYFKKKDGTVILPKSAQADFGGIDIAGVLDDTTEDEGATEEEIAEGAAEVKRENEATTGNSMLDTINRYKHENDQAILIFLKGDKVRLWEDDAVMVGKIPGIDVKPKSRPDRLKVLEMTKTELMSGNLALIRIHGGGKKILQIERVGDSEEDTVTDITKPAPKKTPAPTPPPVETKPEPAVDAPKPNGKPKAKGKKTPVLRGGNG